MKHFYYKCGLVRRSKACGNCTIECEVYKVEYEHLVKVTTFRYNTGATTGEKNEVYEQLVKAGEIPAEHQSTQGWFDDTPRGYCTIEDIDDI